MVIKGFKAGKTSFTKSKGILKNALNAMAKYTPEFNKCPMACILIFRGCLDFKREGINFLDTSAPPFVQRNCWPFNADNVGGNSAGEITSSRYKNFQPFNCAR